MIKGAAIFDCAPFFISPYFAMNMIIHIDLALNNEKINAKKYFNLKERAL
jgi:hypothetical protein